VIADRGARARAALEAGCDLLLVCNERAGVGAVLEALAGHADPVSRSRLARLHGRHPLRREALLASARWREASHAVSGLEPAPELALGDDATA
jgi:beta-N-acetylhexosaminidase